MNRDHVEPNGSGVTGVTAIPGTGAGCPLEAISKFIERYCVLPGPAERDALTLWVAHTWAFDASDTTPYLLVVSAEKGSGKSRLIEVLTLLVRAPWDTSSASAAAVFRKIESDRPTMLLDEVDAIFGQPGETVEALRGVLNAANRRGGSVTRCVGSEHRPQEFSTYCPKLLAGIDTGARIPDTIRHRSITITMKRKTSGESVERLRHRDADLLAAPIRDQLLAWEEAAQDVLRAARPDLPAELGDRAADGWEPLLAIAELAGGEWADRARGAAIELSAEVVEPPSFGLQLLRKLRDVMPPGGKVFTVDALSAINGDEELPFGTWNRGQGLTAHELAAKLRPFGVGPASVRIGSDTAKGYRTSDLEDSWARYLGMPSHPSQASQPVVDRVPLRALGTGRAA